MSFKVLFCSLCPEWLLHTLTYKQSNESIFILLWSNWKALLLSLLLLWSKEFTNAESVAVPSPAAVHCLYVADCLLCCKQASYVTVITLCSEAAVFLNDMHSVCLVSTMAHIPTIQGRAIHWDGKSSLRSMTWNMIACDMHRCFALKCWMEGFSLNYRDV